MAVTTEHCHRCGHTFAVYKGRQCPYCNNYFCNSCILKHEREDQDKERQNTVHKVQIKVVNMFGLPCKDTKVIFTAAEGRKKIIRTGRTDDEGKISFDASMIWHVLQVTFRNVVKEQFITPVSDSVIVKMRSVFGILPKRNLISENSFCTVCKSIFKGPLDVFECPYCHGKHCSKHRLPEEHKCKGSPKSIPSSYRALYSKGKTAIVSK